MGATQVPPPVAGSEPHTITPTLQAPTHFPPLHAAAPPVGAAQTLPQLPQLLASVIVSTHVPPLPVPLEPHSVGKPALQDGAQAVPEQAIVPFVGATHSHGPLPSQSISPVAQTRKRQHDATHDDDSFVGA